ncbi:acyltransferase [Gammaproteobacteria bacterium]|nr:acyltransferase [Gammaproteobacteria bacterium]
MKYRAEIDGLRALAVLPVIFFHAGFELFSGGFVGVDVFFVISGYLITTILIEDIENKRFSIVNFYERRARRILPALFFVMLFCVPFAWILLSDASLDNFGNGLMGVSLFLSNVVFWTQQGYFDESAELNPILHTWSLAVEEQYYVLFPIFLILAWRFGKNRVFWMIVVMAVISLVLSEWGWRNKAVANFYLAPTRAWELFAGSIAAFIVHKQGVQKNNFLSLLGLAAIIFSIFVYDESTPFPSVYALMPVLGVVLLVLYAAKETLAAKFLSAKVFVSIGLISYSAYLWHQPVFAFFRIYTNQISLHWLLALVLIITTFLLSYVSWRIVEKPFRNRNFINKFLLFTLSLMALMSLFAIGYASKQSTIGGEYKLARQLSENHFIYFENLDDRRFIEGRLVYPLEPVDSVVVGSSRVMQINSSIIGEKIQSFTVSGASVEDDIAFGLEAFAKLNYQNIYISADPWLINQYHGQNRYQSVSELLDYWMHRMLMNLPPIQFLDSRVGDLENQSTGNVLASLRNSLVISEVPPTDGEVEAYSKKAYDGSHIYSERSLNKTNIELGFAGLLNYAMTKFEYDNESIENLGNLVSYLQENGVTVTLILSPYHPQLYQMMSTQKPIFLEIENWYREFADRNGIRIIGSYNGNAVGCKEDEFYDGMHPTGSCMQKLFLESHE